MRQNRQKHHSRNYREEKYEQNRSISESRRKQKELRRLQRNQEHKQILQKYQQQHKYFNQQSDQLNKKKYYSKLPDKIDYESLHQLISSTFNHARRRQNIFPIVQRHPDYTLRCVYSGRILSDSEGNLLQKCDQQHSFPQSFQRGSKAGTGRDMHAIFAACKSANGSRGNTPFGIYSQKQVPIQIDEFGTTYSGTPQVKKKTYIPKINSGAVVRSTLYVLVCYKGCANQKYLPKQTINWLVKTAANQQVSLWQKHRNQQLYRLQGNRNPFVDYPEFAKQINFSAGWQNQ